MTKKTSMAHPLLHCFLALCLGWRVWLGAVLDQNFWILDVGEQQLLRATLSSGCFFSLSFRLKGLVGSNAGSRHLDSGCFRDIGISGSMHHGGPLPVKELWVKSWCIEENGAQKRIHFQIIIFHCSFQHLSVDTYFPSSGLKDFWNRCHNNGCGVCLHFGYRACRPVFCIYMEHFAGSYNRNTGTHWDHTTAAVLDIA